MTIRTCFFDMGNVLVFFSHNLMHQNVAELTGIDQSQVKRLFTENGQLVALETGRITSAQLAESLRESSRRDFTTPQLEEAVSAIFRLNESIIPVLQDLKLAQRRLVLLSNTSLPHLEYVQRNFSVLDLFDDLVTSFAVGAMKPDTAIFSAALQKAECPAEECFYTDDIEDYVRQAAGMGIHSRVYTEISLLRSQLQELGAFQPL